MSRLGLFAGACAALIPGVACADILGTLNAEKLCAPGADGVERIDKRVMLAEVLKAHPLPKDLSDFEPGGPRKSLAQTVLDAGPCADRCSPAQTLNMEVLDALAAKSGKLTLRWVGPGPEPTDLDKQYEGFLDPNGGYEVRCTAGTAWTAVERAEAVRQAKVKAERDAALSPWLQVSVAADVDAASKDFRQRSPAAFSIKSDQESGSDSYSIKGAIVWGNVLAGEKYDKLSMQERLDKNGGLSLSPFIALNRQTSDDPKKAVDDLTFGVKLEGRLTRTIPYYLTGSWVTDSADRESSMTRLEAKVPFTVGSGGYLNGAVTPHRYTILALVRGNVVLDYADVGDPGDKAGLLTVEEYQRGGFDLDASLRFGRGEKDPSWLLKVGYQWREDFSDHGGDAEMLTIGLDLRPSDTSHFSFGVSYEFGETLDTLVDTNLVKATIGYRR
jgi:hypothetical protein